LVEVTAKRIMKLSDGSHLTYCTNIHRGESWSETRSALERHLPGIKERVAPGAPMGIGLRLSAIAARDLGAGEVLGEFKDFLTRNGLYVFTINGFPYGPFHGTRVKQDVYQPDWRFAERLEYSNRLADILTDLLPEETGLYGSISTVPGTFGPIGREPEVPAAIAENLLRHAAHLVYLFERTGRTIALALEPEPSCHLETTDDAAKFFENHLYSTSAVARLAALTGLAPEQAESALHRHLGICLDVCHAAVEFEQPAESFQRLARSGIPILKLQLSAALRVPRVNEDTKDALIRFDDGVYLHQVVERRNDGSLVRFLDLDRAFAAIDRAAGNEWRIHCHVPVFEDKLSMLATTQGVLRDVLELHKKLPISQHLEVETYTFGVLPEELRNVPVEAAVGRELDWVKDQLTV
jgi:sugar phosphate isomerase/epimerase